MDKRKQQVKEAYSKLHEFNQLVHRVFVQNANGKKLLEYWVDNLTHEPLNTFGIEPFNLGRVEGRKEFVRLILGAIKQAEEN